MSLKLLAPGTHTLLVDAGRPRTRGLGVTVGGPADRTSFTLGNVLVGNAPDAPALEITLSGPTLFANDDAGLCLFGSPFQIDADGKAIEPNHTFTLRKGSTLHIGGTPEGCRAYLCVVGGFRAKPILGSVTGFAPMKAGELLECEKTEVAGRGLVIFPSPPVADRGEKIVLRCLPGPQADWFDDSFFSQTYRVTPASNRMGIRLDGPALKLPNRELISEPVAPGAVQITNDGKPIVLGVDGQTIGGYPKIAHVISVDLDSLGQLRPGDEVRFERVSENTAEVEAAQMRETLRLWIRRIGLSSA